jgi:phage-related minor tail protein
LGPSVHTNPIFLHVGGAPIRANARSAQWCIDAVKTCWDSKLGMIREEEREAAKKAYDEAESIYRQILAESR